MFHSSLSEGASQNITINGSRVFQEKVDAHEIRINGNGKFQNGVIAKQLLSQGSFKALGNSLVEELKSNGHGQVEVLQTNSIYVTGSFVGNQIVAHDTIEVKGRIHIVQTLQARRISIRQQIPSRVNYICGEDIVKIEADRLSLLNMFMLKKIRGKFNTIKGRKVEINDVDASHVVGEHITVGANCSIDNLIYSNTISIAKDATVNNITHLHDQKKIWEMTL